MASKVPITLPISKDCATDGQDGTASINLDATGDRFCTICLHRKEESIAVCLCVECGHCFLCDECVIVHAKTNMKGHNLEHLKPAKREVCLSHQLPLNMYCNTCQKTICTRCVLLEHSNHKVDSLGDVLNTKVEHIRKTLEEKETQIKALEKEKEKLYSLVGYTSMKGRRDELKRQVNDQVKRNIQAMGEIGKEALRGIHGKFKVISDIEEYERIYTNSKENASVSIFKAEKVLSMPVQDQKYVEELNSLENEIKDIPLADLADVGICSERLCQAMANDYIFIPEDVQSIGRIEGRCQSKLPDEFHPSEDGEYVVEEVVKKEGEYCRHAALLGEKYFALSFFKSKCFFIYEFPFVKKHSFKGDVGGMSATPEGNLLVILAVGKPHYITNIYNPESGDITSSVNVNISRPCGGICETQQHQYIILHGPDDKRQISVLERNGELKVTYEFGTEDQLSRPWRVSCGGKFIFVAGKPEVGIYMMYEGNITRVITLKPKYDSDDIAATAEGDFFLYGKKAHVWYLIRYRLKNGELEWEEKAVRVKKDGKKYPNIATSDGRTIVANNDCNIQFFKA